MKKIKWYIPCEYLISLLKQRSCEIRKFSPNTYGQTENDGLFLLTPQWLCEFEKEVKDAK